MQNSSYHILSIALLEAEIPDGLLIELRVNLFVEALSLNDSVKILRKNNSTFKVQNVLY